jgi:hypothetical protein
MVLGQCEQGKGDAKENADDRGSDETDQEKIEDATDARPFRRRTAAGHRSQLCFSADKFKQPRLRIEL